MLAAAPIYIALASLIYITLALRVIRQRYAAKAALGDAGDKELQKRIRAHGNFAEYAPLLMILLTVTELQGAPVWVCHLLGLAIVASRLGHAYFISQTPEPLSMRRLTMGTTFGLIALMATGLLAHAVF